MQDLLERIAACTICKDYLPFPPKPVLAASQQSRILVIGQAPGLKVQNSGIPWDDASGNELRRWLGVEREDFYDTQKFALVPMGFCYPGKGKSGDLPPRPECAPTWHPPLLQYMPNIKLTLLIGQYSQQRYLGKAFKPSLTENVRHYHEFLPQYLPLVHPSPRNRIWQKRNPWFEAELVPELRKIVADILA